MIMAKKAVLFDLDGTLTDSGYEAEPDKLISIFTNEPLSNLSEYIKYYCWCVHRIDLDKD